MKHMIFCSLMLILLSCSSAHKNSRNISSVNRDLSGTFLGVSDYTFGHKGPNKAATRIYLQEIEDEPGQYHAVLLEYVDLLRMAPDYIVSNKIPVVAKKIGFLNSITRKIAAYKVIPDDKDGTYKMWPLVVMGEKIVPNLDGQPRILTLSQESNLAHPLEGASISSVRKDEPQEIFFPKKDDEKINGVQYTLAKFTYAKAKLGSTWRKNFLPGPYLSQYARVDDVVLELSTAGDDQMAEFKINRKEKGSDKKRAKVFTNKKSAFLKGKFNITEPLDGMFLFFPIQSTDHTSFILKGRIGLFIDVFDATESLNQDVVELALIDSEQPEDFLMYYEHPDNGEGN